MPLSTLQMDLPCNHLPCKKQLATRCPLQRGLPCNSISLATVSVPLLRRWPLPCNGSPFKLHNVHAPCTPACVYAILWWNLVAPSPGTLLHPAWARCRRLWLRATAPSPSRLLPAQLEDSCRFECESRVQVTCRFITCRDSSPHGLFRLQSLVTVAYQVSIPCLLSLHVPVDCFQTKWFGGYECEVLGGLMGFWKDLAGRCL